MSLQSKKNLVKIQPNKKSLKSSFTKRLKANKGRSKNQFKSKRSLRASSQRPITSKKKSLKQYGAAAPAPAPPAAAAPAPAAPAAAAPAEAIAVPGEASVLEGISRSESNASTVLEPEGELQLQPVEQEIAKGGIKINDNITKPDTYFATLDEESTVKIHLMRDTIKLYIYKNSDKKDNSHLWHILFDTQIFNIKNIFDSNKETLALKLIFKKNDGGSNEESLTFRYNEDFNLQKAARILTYLFYDKNNKDSTNKQSIIEKMKQLSEKALQPDKELQLTQYSNIIFYVGGSR